MLHEQYTLPVPLTPYMKENKCQMPAMQSKTKIDLKEKPCPNRTKSFFPRLTTVKRTATCNIKQLSPLISREIAVISIRNQVHLMQSDEASAFDQFPANKHDYHDRDLNVVADEINSGETRAES